VVSRKGRRNALIALKPRGVGGEEEEEEEEEERGGARDLSAGRVNNARILDAEA
jgi:hypothetical protein